MRVLVTGMTTLQTRPPEERRTSVKKIDVPALVRDTLVALGHEVDWRVVEVGEDLRRYDWVFLCWAPCLSFNARPGSLGAIWAAAQPVPHVFFYDDWQVRQMHSQLRTLARHPHYLDKKIGGGRFFDKVPVDVLDCHRDALMASVDEVVGPWTHPHRLAGCPMYSWGDHASVLEHVPCQPGRITYLDPSHAVAADAARVLAAGVPPTKQLAWTMCSLSKQLHWLERQGVEWPVAVFGSKGDGSRRLASEDDVVRETASRAGVLSPKYYSAGSGWWRSRFLYSAMAGCVIAGDPKEASCLGDAYAVKPADVERLAPAALAELAAAQREALYPTLWSRDRWFEAVASLPRYLGVA